jgi:hypothetical protein
MRSKQLFGLIVTVAALMPLRFASADFIAVSGGFFRPNGGFRPVTAAESAPQVGGAAPAGGLVYRFYVTTDADILGIEQVILYGRGLQPLTGLYNNAFGAMSNAEPGDPAFAAISPAIAADSWITTPGFTFRFGPNLPGDGTTTFADSTNDGPVHDFQFAQFTLPATTLFGFSGRIAIASDSGGPFIQAFHFPIWPEPSSLVMAGLAALGVVTVRRRQ